MEGGSTGPTSGLTVRTRGRDVEEDVGCRNSTDRTEGRGDVRRWGSSDGMRS